MGDFQDPDYDRRKLAHAALTQARDTLQHFDDPEVAQAAFAAHAPGLVQAGWAPELVDAVHRGIGGQNAGPLIQAAMLNLHSQAAPTTGAAGAAGLRGPEAPDPPVSAMIVCPCPDTISRLSAAPAKATVVTARRATRAARGQDTGASISPHRSVLRS